MIQKKSLLNYIERLNSYQIVRSLSFFSLYDEWFLEVTKALEEEISENLLLTTTDKERYLKHVKEKITDDIVYQKDIDLLHKWIKKYELDELKFPFIENEEVQQLLDTDLKEPILDYKRRKLCTDIQMDFYCHAAVVEKYKMIDFIDKLLGLEIGNQQSVVPEDTRKDDANKNTTWFKVGLCFAKGEAQILYDKYKLERGHFKKITLELGFKKTDRPHFSETINNSTNHPKNLYRDFYKMKTIHDYCKKNEILICEDFNNNFNALQAK